MYVMWRGCPYIDCSLTNVLRSSFLASTQSPYVQYFVIVFGPSSPEEGM